MKKSAERKAPSKNGNASCENRKKQRKTTVTLYKRQVLMYFAMGSTSSAKGIEHISTDVHEI